MICITADAVSYAVRYGKSVVAMSFEAWSALAALDPSAASKMLDCINGVPDSQSETVCANIDVLIQGALAKFTKLNGTLANHLDFEKSQTFLDLWRAAQQAVLLTRNPLFCDRQIPTQFLVSNYQDWMIAFFAGIDPLFSNEMAGNAEPDQWIHHGFSISQAHQVAIIDLFGVPDAEQRLIEFCNKNNSHILALNYPIHAVPENNIQRCIGSFANLGVMQMLSDTKISNSPTNIDTLSTLIEHCFGRELARAENLNDVLLHYLGKSSISNVLVSEHRSPGMLGLQRTLSNKMPSQIDIVAHGGWPIQRDHRTAILLTEGICWPSVKQSYIPWHSFDDGDLPQTTSIELGRPSLPKRLNVTGGSPIKRQIKILAHKFADKLRPAIKRTKYKVGILLTSYDIDNQEFIQSITNIATGLELQDDIEIEFRGREVESAELFILHIMNQNIKNPDDVFKRVKFDVVGQKSLRRFFTGCDLIVDYGFPTSAVLFAFQAKKPVTRLLHGEHRFARLLAEDLVPHVDLNDPIGYFFELLQRPEQLQRLADQQQGWFREAIGGSVFT